MGRQVGVIGLGNMGGNMAITLARKGVTVTGLDPSSAACEPARGRRTALVTLSRRAEVEPNKLFGSFPLTDDIEDGFRDFTFAELAKAIDACAWHLKEVFGTSEKFEAILYMGTNDFRYTIIMYAAIKCGFQVRDRGLQRSQTRRGTILNHLVGSIHQSSISY